MATATQGRSFLDPATLDKIARLDLRARLIVEGFITGHHKSPYNGFAVEFATHREYVPGDDLRHIDWKVWSKTDRLYIKEYEEETNLKCTIILDCSKSMKYGDHRKPGLSKYEYGATAAACLAHMLQQQQDSVGLVTFSNKVENTLPASTNPAHQLRMIHMLEQTQPNDETDVSDVFRDLAEQLRQRGIVVLISDLFVDLDTLASSLQRFRHRRHEVIVFHVMDDDELTFPFQDNILFKGLEVDAQRHVEPRTLRKSYLEAVEDYLHQVRRLCAINGIDYQLMNTKDPLDAALSGYLAFRQRTLRAAGRRP